MVGELAKQAVSPFKSAELFCARFDHLLGWVLTSYQVLGTIRCFNTVDRVAAEADTVPPESDTLAASDVGLIDLPPLRSSDSILLHLSGDKTLPSGQVRRTALRWGRVRQSADGF